jgi:hypothetical protein
LTQAKQGDGTIAPITPTHEDQPGTRLSSLIDAARVSGDRNGYVERRDRALANGAFTRIAAAIEHGLRTVDPRSEDAAILQRMRDAVRRR